MVSSMNANGMNVDMSAWQGRVDAGERGDTTRLHQIVNVADAALPPGAPVVLGFACDEGVKRNHGRPGAAAAPGEIRRMLANLPAHGLRALFDAGDVVCDGDRLEDAQRDLGAAVADLLARRARPVVLGGGHEMAFGTYLGLRAWLDAQPAGARRLLIVNFDAHFDLRTARPASSGTPFDQIAVDCEARGLPFLYDCYGVSRAANTAALFARADELGVHYVEDSDMQERHLDRRLAELDRRLAGVDHVYLTIDMDGLPAATAPGVSAPAAYGVPLTVVEEMVKFIRASGKLRVADIAEYNPAFDIDRRTARVAARLAYQVLGT